MLRKTRRGLGMLAMMAGLTAVLSTATPNPASADDKELANSLRAGGLVIVMRHCSTVTDKGDSDPFHLDNIAAQRNLNDKGKAQAQAFGDALKQIGAPVGTVLTSQFNRGYETAVLAGLKNIQKSVDITEGGLVVSPDENNRRTAALRKLLATAPAAGTNTILVSHKPNIIDALGKDWVDTKDGQAMIYRPEGGAYKFIATVQMEEWSRLATAAR